MALVSKRRRPRPTATKFVLRHGVLVLAAMTVVWWTLSVRASVKAIRRHPPEIRKLPFQRENIDALPPLPAAQEVKVWELPKAFEGALQRAQETETECLKLEKDGHDTSSTVKYGDEDIASLPAFGIISALDEFQSDSIQSENVNPSDWQCELPPLTECSETQFSVVFMAYNPDRLGKTMREIRKLLEEWSDTVAEVIITWNGERKIDESKDGRYVLDYASKNPRLRIVYPLKMGLTNDLLNRYHPQVVKVTKTKAILYYDDDGPFYSRAAVTAGFELWKRHSSVQVGAMSRELTLSDRQKTLATHRDDGFVPHCSADKLDYNFRYFANYDANMVLPSGSFLHANYLCFLWHPVLEEVRQFVRAHPVHPDDITVSTVVSQLAGKAPRVYSRRLNPDESAATKRRLQEVTRNVDEKHRRLMHGIDWDKGAGMTNAKQRWADLRSIAINALTRYFGSLNGGSIGWCEGTKYHIPSKKDGQCQPIMAKQGMLPWMNPDNSPKECIDK